MEEAEGLALKPSFVSMFLRMTPRSVEISDGQMSEILVALTTTTITDRTCSGTVARSMCQCLLILRSDSINVDYEDIFDATIKRSRYLISWLHIRE